MYKRRGWTLVICAVVAWPVWTAAQQETADEKSEEKTAPAAEEEKGAAKKEPAKEEPAKEESADPPKTPAPTPPAPAPQAKPKATMDKGKYAVRLRDLEGRVNRLKEQIFRSKARLSLLAETVLDRKIAGSRLNILFRNEMGGSFRLVKATFLLDGGPIFNKTDESGNLAEREVIDLFNGPVVPGDHTISVILNYRGHGYGIFSYLKGYAFKTKSSRTFTVGEGKALRLEIVGYEKGGVATPLEERPDIRYIKNLTDYEPPKSDDSVEPEGGE